jgi:thymidylate synthase ThyX
MHFLTLRLHAGAQYEIRQFALGMLKLALPHFPVSLGEWANLNAAKLEIDQDIFTKEFSNTAE